MQAAYEWYNLHKDGLGDEFIKEIDETIEIIQQNPYQFEEKKQARVAIVKRFPFGVFYLI